MADKKSSMEDRSLESLFGTPESRQLPLHNLRPRRVRNILLVSSLYDFYTFEEDGRFTELLTSDYLELNLRFAPNIVRVSTAEEALEEIRSGQFDLVISMLRVGGMDVAAFGKAIKYIDPQLPLVLLAFNTRELPILEALAKRPEIESLFVWHGDVRLFLAIVKSFEDKLNAWHDALVAGVQCIILIEDSVSFYSTYLPMLYTEIVTQTQALMADGVNNAQKLFRMRARPKILLATTYEEGLKLFQQYKEFLLGVMVDVGFPKDGVFNPKAGIQFAEMVLEKAPDIPVMMQSSDPKNEEFAKAMGAHFIDKNSPTLLHDFQKFMREYLGFGDFVFRTQDGKEVRRASDIGGLIDALEVIPDESLLYHASHNHFSTWLMARTEFDLAKALRPKKIEDFKSPKHLRDHLIITLQLLRRSSRQGVVAEFSRGIFKGHSGFVRIGSGSLGGKGRGLAFINSVLSEYHLDEHLPGIDAFVPPTTVLATGVFDRFMDNNRLTSLAFGNASDEMIRKGFLEADLPVDIVEALRMFLTRVDYPLAVRSSSLLEDAFSQPFAGIYKTYMIPNNHRALEVRLEKLCEAIKLVYASTYYRNAKSYIENTPTRIEDEKMAIVIQQVIGRKHENYIYPDISGVARSHNFYPMEGMKPEDGIASVALGLGVAVVEGYPCVRFSPAHPQRLYQFSSTEDFLENSQREFTALDMSRPGPMGGLAEDENSNLVKLGLDIAEAHGTLNHIGSVYSSESDAVYDGISRPGVRLVTFAGILKDKSVPLANVLSFLLKLGSSGFSCPVEIEFALNIRKSPGEPHEFGFLQIRPFMVTQEYQDIHLDEINREDAICITDMALGHGMIDDICDIIYVKRDAFDQLKTMDIAAEIGGINEKLKKSNRHFVLIGPGRWGTSDQWYGIPVTWSQISGVRCIVETSISGASVTPSQGTHFFQNITSFGIGYFTIGFKDNKGMLDMDWIDTQPVKEETKYLKHLQFDKPVQILVDSRDGEGVILKPGVDANPHPY